MKLKWLHFSDIHFSYENYNTKKMRHELLKFLRRIKEEIHFIVITGDIAFQHKSFNADLKLFLNNILDVFELDKSNLHIVPGNHDLKRGGPRGQIVKSIQNSEDSFKELEELDKDSYKILTKGFNKFAKFYKEFFKEDYCMDSLHRVIKGKNYNIIALNTCIVSGLHKEEGKLLLHHNKLFDLLKQQDIENEDKLNIAIGHHGLMCFIDKEKRMFRNTLSDFKIDMYLSGHFHKPEINFDNNNTNETYHFVVGSNIVDEYAIPCFMQGEVDLSNGSAIARYYKWYEDNENWDVYSGIDRRFNNGEMEFDIDKLKSKKKIKEIEIDLEEDNFKDFIIEFHTNIAQNKKRKKIDLNDKDLIEKFENMKCSITFTKEFEELSKYFPLIDEIMDSGSYVDFDKKIVIPELIYSEYHKVYNNYNTGAEIVEAMKTSIFNQYKNKEGYPISRLKVYIKILIYWSIYGCNIFNEKLGD